MKSYKLADIIKTESKHYETAVRQPRASFLVWFLINYFKLEEDDAASFVCDSPNDKGVDGIFVDDISEEIYIFQSKYSPNPGSGQGDNDLKNLVGTKNWFHSEENIDHLDNSSAHNDLKSLVKRVKVFDAIQKEYDLFLFFVTNKIFDNNAKEYLKTTDEFFIPFDLKRLEEEYIYTGGDIPVIDKFTFPFDESNSIKGKIAGKYDYFIFPIKVIDLIRLKGIQDKTLFTKNVRYGLGRTRVNKEIRKTTLNKDEHKYVILYHNGLTLIAEEIEKIDNEISIINYSMVNGAQSTVSFYENQSNLSSELTTLLKVIKTGKEDRIAKKITYFTNNQNSISLKDLKSNDKVQQDLQKEVSDMFGSEIFLQIKRGEDLPQNGEILNNDFVAQLITAFYLKEPHITHQKTKIFSDKYNEIFNRNINAYYIYLLYKMYSAIENNISSIDHTGIQTYKTTKFFFMFVFRLILEKDEEGRHLISSPKDFFDSHPEINFLNVFGKLLGGIVPDFNFRIKEEERNADFFDYKNELRNYAKVEQLGQGLVVDYQKAINRYEDDSFNNIIAKAKNSL